MPSNILRHSVAWSEPITPGNTPSTPLSRREYSPVEEAVGTDLDRSDREHFHHSPSPALIDEAGVVPLRSASATQQDEPSPHDD